MNETATIDRETLQQQFKAATDEVMRLEREQARIPRKIEEAQKQLKDLRASQFKIDADLAEERTHVVTLLRLLSELPE